MNNQNASESSHTRSPTRAPVDIDTHEIDLQALNWDAFTGGFGADDFRAFAADKNMSLQQLLQFEQLPQCLRDTSATLIGSTVFSAETAIEAMVVTLANDTLLAMCSSAIAQAGVQCGGVVPDVVLQNDGRLMGFFEVKKPGSDVFKSKQVAAQLLDYLNTLDDMGVRPVFGMLCCACHGTRQLADAACKAARSGTCQSERVV